MMNTTHTPGPWRVEDPPTNDRGASLAIMGPGKADRAQLYIAEVWKVDDTAREMEMDAEGNANARLIASAPKMLKALQSLIQWHENPDAPDEAWMQARDAIAEAKEE